jgi:recombinational DNA repair protein (RecF pathway)
MEHLKPQDGQAVTCSECRLQVRFYGSDSAFSPVTGQIVCPSCLKGETALRLSAQIDRIRTAIARLGEQSMDGSIYFMADTTKDREAAQRWTDLNKALFP